jgi:hypothetical protein
MGGRQVSTQTRIPDGFEIEWLPEPKPTNAPLGTSGLPEGYEIEDDVSDAVKFRVTDYGDPSKMTAEQIKAQIAKQRADGLSDLEIEQWLQQWGRFPDISLRDYLADPTGKDLEVTPDYDIGPLDAAWAGLKSGALRGWDDEWQALWGAAGNKLGTVLGLNESTADFADIYETLLAQNRDYKDQAWRKRPLAYGLGFVPGAFMGPSYAALARAQGPLGNVGGAAAIGGIEGAVSGAGNAEGGISNRLLDAAVGGGAGAALAPFMLPVANIAGGLVDSGINLARRALGRENALNTGLEALVRRAPQNTDAMNARLAEMDAANVPARLVDLVDESGRGVIRSAGSKMTPAREELARAADDVYINAQNRIAQQARDNISNSPLTSREIASDIEQQRSNLGSEFRAVGGSPVQLDEKALTALSTPEARRVLNEIGRYMTASERGQVTELVDALRRAERVGSPEVQARRLVKGYDKMSPAAKQKIMQELEEQGLIIKPLDNLTMTVDVADKFARIIRENAKNSALLRVAEDYADTLRGAARSQYPQYDEALKKSAALARVGEAATGTGRFEKTDFLRDFPDDFIQALRRAATEGPTRSPRFTPEERSEYLRLFQEGGNYQMGVDSFTPLEKKILDELKIVPMDPIGYGFTGGNVGIAEKLNYALREGLPLGPETQRMYDAIIEEFQLTPPTEAEMLLKRYIGAQGGSPVSVDLNPRSFSSTTADSGSYIPDIAAMNVDIGGAGHQMDIRVPEGNRVLRLNPSKQWDDESEVLLPPGTFTETSGRTQLDPDSYPDIPVDLMSRQSYDFQDAVPPRPTNPSEAEAIRIRARDAVVDRATSGSGAQAMATARQLSRGTAQRQRNRALLGEEGAAQLERAMENEVRRVVNTQYIDPRTGSPTAGRLEDNSAVREFLDVGADVMGSGKTGLIRAARSWLRSAGIKNVDAERLVRDAISEDPARIRQAIDYLARRGVSRERAGSLMRWISSTAAGRAMGGTFGSERPRPIPNSVRATVNRARVVEE